MHTGFLADRYDPLQFIIFPKCQRQCDLIQTIIFQDFFQFIRGSKHCNAFIGISRLFIIIQDSTDFIPPLRICKNPINKCFCSSTVSYKDQMTKVESFAPDLSQTPADQISRNNLQHNVDHIEICQHPAGIIFNRLDYISQREKCCHDDQNADGIGFYNVAAFQPSSLHSFGCVEIACQIQHQVQRYNTNKCHTILCQCQSPLILQDQKLVDPGQYICDTDHHCINHNMKTVEIPLIVFNQESSSFSPHFPLLPGRKRSIFFQSST